MRVRFTFLLVCGLVCAVSPALAQRPGGGDRPAASSSGADALVSRLMKFDKNKDGQLTKDEITDERLIPLFERADANHDGVVTADELKALHAKEGADLGFGRRGGRGRPDGETADNGPPGERRGPPRGEGADDRGGPGGPGGGPGDPNGPGDGPGRRAGGPGGGPGGPGGFGGPPQPGQVLPDRLQEMLKLSDEQKKQVAELQKEVDAKLAKILTEDQQKQLKEMRNRRPLRRNNPDRPDGGPGGPGGPPRAE